VPQVLFLTPEQEAVLSAASPPPAHVYIDPATGIMRLVWEVGDRFMREYFIKPDGRPVRWEEIGGDEDI
jgi:hypothetical protein